MKRRVVITGMGLIGPNAHGLAAFENALREGRSGIRFMPDHKKHGLACHVAGVPENIDEILPDYFTKKQIRHLNHTIGYAVISALDAWRDAGFEISNKKAPPDWRTGVIFGCGVTDLSTIATKVVPSVEANRISKMGTRMIVQLMNSAPSAYIAGTLGLGAQATSNSSACNTSSESLIDAVMKIRMGLADRFVAGGCEGGSVYMWSGFDAMYVLARKFNDRPEKASRPMSKSACGFVPGCGGGALILEELETALKRNARIYAEIIGVHLNCGGQRLGGTLTMPNNDAVKYCIREAVMDADILSSDIDAINGHLTATFADVIELKNWSNALELPPENFPFINATKSMIGHCIGAAGAIESISSVLQLHKGFLHPSINCEDLHPALTAFDNRIVRSLKVMPELKTIAKASFGFGDVNSCLIFRKWPASHN